MASKKTATATKPQAVPAPKLDAKKEYSPDFIVEEELDEIRQLRAYLAAEEARLKPFKDRLKKLEADGIAKVQAKKPIVGDLLAQIAESVGSRRVSWEGEYFGHLVAEHGFTKEQCKARKEELLGKATPGTSKELVIQPRPPQII